MAKITNEQKTMIRNALLQGKVGYEISYDLNVSLYHVNKVRKELMAEGKNSWHSKEYYYDKYPLR